jgi:hypothetical protein
MTCLKRSPDFGLKMGVGLTFLGKKADLCTKNARDMSKKAEKMKKMRICVSKSCVFLYFFYSFGRRRRFLSGYIG